MEVQIPCQAQQICSHMYALMCVCSPDPQASRSLDISLDLYTRTLDDVETSRFQASDPELLIFLDLKTSI